jgi:crotonobetainyl-CoA:carnitine CoA-transferase CaiB-like acyl-CoA transferase
MNTSKPTEHSERADQELPFAGLRVLEFCHTIMGPSAGLILADLGADVIKIEPAPDGDRTRRMPGFAAGFFGAFNRNKRSLGIDLKHPRGKETILELLRQSDVLLENFAPGAMDRLGLGFDALTADNPGLVYCSLKGFLKGPYEHRPALDEVVQFMGGLAYMTGPPGRPLRAGTSVIDIMGGTFAVVAVMAALRERDRTGKGQLVKSALFESTAFLMAQHMIGQVMTGQPVPPMPARRGAWAVYEPFDTSDDEQIFIGITSDNHWQRFCDEFALADLASDPSLQSNEARVAERQRILPIIADIVARHTRSEMVAICDRISIPFAPVAKTEDLFDDPHFNAEGRMLEVTLPNGMTTKLPRLPIEMGNHDFGVRRQPPGPGAHSREILSQFGLPAEVIDQLAVDGVILDGE